MRTRYHQVSSRALFVTGLWLLACALALLIFMTSSANAKVKAPSTRLVTTRLHAALEDALFDYGLAVDGGYLIVSCQAGTRGDPTRRVRWFCIAQEYDELGEVVYRTRLRVRAKRGSMWTAIDHHGWGHVRLNQAWYIDTSRLL